MHVALNNRTCRVFLKYLWHHVHAIECQGMYISTVLTYILASYCGIDKLEVKSIDF